MSPLDRMWGWLGARQDSALELPGPVDPPQRQEARQDSVFNPLTGFGGPNDKGSAGVPSPFVRRLSDTQLLASYANSGIVRRIVDLPPSGATRKGWTVPDIGKSEDKRLRTFPRCCTGMQLARLLGGCPMLMVTEDDIPRQFRSRPERWLEQPLDLKRVGVLHALQVFDSAEATPIDIERDIASVGYRSPRLWSIGADGFSATVHASRIIHWRGARRPPSQARLALMPDDSVIQSVWDEISRLTQTMQGGAILAAELRQAVIKVGNLPKVGTGDESTAMKAKLAMISLGKSMLNLIVLSPTDEYESSSGAPTGFKDLSDAAQQMVCTVLGWPTTMFTGEAPGGLDSGDEAGMERERQVYSHYQETQREPLEQLYTVVYAQQDGPTRGVIPDEWEIEFLPLDEPKAEAVAALHKTYAEIDEINSRIGVYGPEEIVISRYSDDGWSPDMQPVQIPDPLEEAEIEAERQRIIAEALPPEPAQPRVDESDGCCILVPAADPGLRRTVERAIGQTLNPETEPHVTVLYLGAGLTEDELAEVASVVLEESRVAEPGTLERATLRTFPHGSDGTPVVIEFSDTWPLSQLHDRLLTRLAHLVRVRQHPRFRPHLTIGYAPAPVTTEASTALLGVDVSTARVPLVELRVVAGDQVVVAVPVGG